MPNCWNPYALHRQDYEHASPMECVIHPQIPYISLPSIVRIQRKYLMKKLKEYSKSHMRRPGEVDYSRSTRSIIPAVQCLIEPHVLQTLCTYYPSNAVGNYQVHAQRNDAYVLLDSWCVSLVVTSQLLPCGVCVIEVR